MFSSHFSVLPISLSLRWFFLLHYICLPFFLIFLFPSLLPFSFPAFFLFYDFSYVLNLLLTTRSLASKEKRQYLTNKNTQCPDKFDFQVNLYWKNYLLFSEIQIYLGVWEYIGSPGCTLSHLSPVWVFVTPRTGGVLCPCPGFSRQGYWSGWLFPPPGTGSPTAN